MVLIIKLASYGLFFEEVLSIHTANVDHLVFDKIDMKEIINDFIIMQKSKSKAGTSIVNYFQASSEDNTWDLSPYSRGGRFQGPYHSDMDKAFQASLPLGFGGEELFGAFGCYIGIF